MPRELLAKPIDIKIIAIIIALFFFINYTHHSFIALLLYLNYTIHLLYSKYSTFSMCKVLFYIIIVIYFKKCYILFSEKQKFSFEADAYHHCSMHPYSVE